MGVGGLRTRLAVTLIAALLAAVLPSTAIAQAGPVDPPADAGVRPNIVVVMTDDQTSDLLRVMPQTLDWLAEGGTTFSDSIVVNPLCCPAHAALLTGQYSKHHGVYDNRPPMGGMYALDHGDALPVWLQEAGYRTGLIGKAMVGYHAATGVPPGWDSWQAKGGTAYYDYTIVDDGELVPYGSAPEDYATDVFARRSADTIRRFAGEGQPFFLLVNSVAPHNDVGGLPIPAPRHEGAFAGEPLPADPAINELDVSDKAPLISALPPIGPRELEQLRAFHQAQLESLLAVDELMATLRTTLQETGELDNTVVMFTSDNGYVVGQHRLRSKSLPYQPSIDVPLLVGGPGFPAGEVVDVPAANIDLAVTIAALAGAAPTRVVDGIDLRALVADPTARGGPVLVESAADKLARCFDALYSGTHKYIRWSDGTDELYDLTVDPFELDSIAADATNAALRADLAAQLETMRNQGKPCLPSAEVSVGDITVHEPGDGQRTVELPVTLSQPTSAPVTVDFTLASGAAPAAQIGADYAPPAHGSVVIPAGEVLGHIPVDIRADAIDEPQPESIAVTIEASSSGDTTLSLRRPVGTVAIVDRLCCTGLVAIGDVQVVEGHNAARTLRFPVTLAEPVGEPTSISYRVVRGTTSQPDVAASAGTIVLEPGAAAGVIPVLVRPDAWLEETETFDVEVTGVGAPPPPVWCWLAPPAPSSTTTPPSRRPARSAARRRRV